MPILFLRGERALSGFRVEKLLQKAAALGLPEAEIRSEYWYFADCAEGLDAADMEKLEALLAGQVASALPQSSGSLHLFLITPRIGTISPWSSKATDIAWNCGLKAVERIERGIAFYVSDVASNATASRRCCMTA